MPNAEVDWDPPRPSRQVAQARRTLEREGKSVAAVAYATKHGFVFVLDRETGRSLFSIAKDQGSRRPTARQG